MKNKKLEHYLTPYTKINLKQIEDLNIKPEKIKLLEENRTVFDINQSSIVPDLSPKAKLQGFPDGSVVKNPPAVPETNP